MLSISQVNRGIYFLQFTFQTERAEASNLMAWRKMEQDMQKAIPLAQPCASDISI